MRRRRLLASVGGLLAAGAAGCTASGTDAPGGTPDDGTTTDDPTTNDPTTTDDPTTTAGNDSVEYVVEAGAIPGEIGSLSVTLRAVVVETEADFENNRCWRETYRGPHKPTITPIRTPAGDCSRSEAVTLDLTEVSGGRSLGPFDVPGSSAGHGLIVTDAAAEYDDGSPVASLKGSGGLRVNLVEGRPADRYRVEFALEAYEDRPYDYWLQSAVTDPSGDGAGRIPTDGDGDRTAPGPAVAEPHRSGP